MTREVRKKPDVSILLCAPEGVEDPRAVAARAGGYVRDAFYRLGAWEEYLRFRRDLKSLEETRRREGRAVF